MRISFSPQRRDDVLEVTKQGDSLTINGEVFDFSVVPEGATLPSSAVPNEFVVGDITRIDGELQITLLLPHGPNPSQVMAFPSGLASVPDGKVAIPHHEVPSNV